MGAQHKRKMQSTVLLVSLAVIFANASPISDSVVPEDTDFAMDTDLSEARATIDDMITDGASDADCRKLTGDTINDIKSSVEILQKEIDAVSSGVECNTEGQTQVKITAEAQTKAHTTLTTATKELTKTITQGRLRLPCVQHTHCWQVRHLLLPFFLRDRQGILQNRHKGLRARDWCPHTGCHRG